MRLSPSIVVLTLLTATFASSANGLSSSKFQETITLPAGNAITIKVSLSEDMQHRAENLPKEFHDRSRARNSRDGFGGNGFYGEKDLAQLQEKLNEKVTSALEDKGVAISDTASYTLNLIIADARPNRPTFRQLSKSSSLSFNSVSLGGAEISGQLVDGSGQVIGTSSYAWYENNLGDSLALKTWSDAERSISRFARETAKSILD